MRGQGASDVDGPLCQASLTEAVSTPRDMPRPLTAAGRVHAWLRQAIVDLTLPPGATISRAALAAAHGVSQTPVREALLRLEADGLVESFPQSRTQVSRIDPLDLFEARFHRLALETDVVRRLAKGARTDVVARARAILSRQAAVDAPAPGSPAGLALDRAFHRSLFDGVGMARVHDNLARDLDLLARCHALARPGPETRRLALDFHRTILERIEAGDPAGAEQAMRSHLCDEPGELARLVATYPDYFTGSGTATSPLRPVS